MLLRYITQKPVFKAGLSVALFALMSGMAYAQDDVPADATELTGEETILIADPAVEYGPEDCIDCNSPVDENGEVFAIDPIDPAILQDGGVSDPAGVPFEGEPMNIDGIGDGLPLPEEGGEVPVVTQEFPQSTCDGCESEFLPGGPEVQRTTTNDSRSGTGIDTATEVVSDENNICFNADLYIPLLCDWQRPFLGDRMP